MLISDRKKEFLTSKVHLEDRVISNSLSSNEEDSEDEDQFREPFKTNNVNNKSKKYRRNPNSNEEDSNNEDYVQEHTKLNVNNKSKENRRRPNPVTVKTPENNHFTNNNKKNNKKPLIALIGDSTLKNLSGYQLGKNCKGTTIMVRSQRGGKVKNMKNLMIDLL